MWEPCWPRPAAHPLLALPPRLAPPAVERCRLLCAVRGGRHLSGGIIYWPSGRRGRHRHPHHAVAGGGAARAAGGRRRRAAAHRIPTPRLAATVGSCPALPCPACVCILLTCLPVLPVKAKACLFYFTINRAARRENACQGQWGWGGVLRQDGGKGATVVRRRNGCTQAAAQGTGKNRGSRGRVEYERGSDTEEVRRGRHRQANI